MMKKPVGILLVFSMIAPLAHAGKIEQKIPIEHVAEESSRYIFSDVPEGHENYIAINWLKSEGIVNGYMDGSFDPDKKVNRAEALKMIFECLKIPPEITIKRENFPDVPKNTWFYKYIMAANARRVVNGYEDGYFRPENFINLAETLKIAFELLERNFKEPSEDPYTDVPKDAWFAKYAIKAKNRSILSVNLDGSIHPEDNLTRGDIAELMYRIQKSKEGFRFGKVTYYGDVFNGRGTAFDETFDQNAMTAAHKELPYNSIVRVTNLKNGKQVEVRINDRGPFNEGLALDLSKAAFEKIANTREGYIQAQYEIIYTP